MDPVPLDSLAPESRQYKLGRSPDCDLVFNNPFVSGVHACLAQQRGKWWLADQGSTNGTYLNGLDEEHRVGGEEVEVCPGDILYLSRQRRIPVDLLLAQIRSGNVGQVLQQHSFSGTKDVVRIGRAPDNDIVIESLQASHYHAEVRTSADGSREIVDLHGKTGTYHAGRLLKKASAPLSAGDSVEIAGTSISLQFGSSGGQVQIGAEKAGWFLLGEGLGRRVPDDNGSGLKTILQGVDITIQPGELVAILGPSGCGKTTLMKILAGADTAYEGRMLYDDEGGLHDLRGNLGRLGPQIGYVPQEDELREHLTVRETLFHHARQKLRRDVSDAEIRARADQVLTDLDLAHLAGERIGSTRNKTLSGGQKKRVNIGMELMGDPRVLFLDEPTSGLSSADAKVVVDLLRRLATEQEMPVVLTIHQPALSLYRKMDEVVYLKEGRRVYQGPPLKSIKHFSTIEGNDALDGPVGIMEVVEDLPTDKLLDGYISSLDYQRTVVDRRARLLAGSNLKLDASGEQSQGFKQILAGVLGSPWLNLPQLLLRESVCKVRDSGSFLVLLAQAPVIALFMGWVFHGDQADVNTPLFMLALVAFWFGLNSACREVVRERTLLERELRGGQSLPVYLLSKFAIQGASTLVQSFFLVGLARPIIGLEASLGSLVVLCWIVSLSGITLGLLISSVVRSEVAATAWVPLVLIPCILFSGKLKPHADLEKGFRDSTYRLACGLNPVRWAYEANVYLETAGGRKIATAASSGREFSKWWGRETRRGKVPPFFNQKSYDAKSNDEKKSWTQSTLPKLVVSWNVVLLMGFTFSTLVLAWMEIRFNRCQQLMDQLKKKMDQWKKTSKDTPS